MKHDFNYPLQDTVPKFTGLPCECMTCQKNTVHTKQMFDRSSNYQNSFDFPDWNDLTITATELLGKVTGNPVAVSSAQAAKAVKTAVKTEINKVNAGGTSTWTNLPKPDPKTGKIAVPRVEPKKLAPQDGQITIDWFGWLGPLKWILIAVLAVVLLGVFLRIKG